PPPEPQQVSPTPQARSPAVEQLQLLKRFDTHLRPWHTSLQLVMLKGGPVTVQVTALQLPVAPLTLAASHEHGPLLLSLAGSASSQGVPSAGNRPTPVCSTQMLPCATLQRHG